VNLFNNSIVSVIDNTKVGLASSVFTPGYSDITRLVHPNEAVVIRSDEYQAGERLFLDTIGIVRLSDKYHLIPNENVIISSRSPTEKSLKKPGILVSKKTITQKNIITIRTQEFFKVEQSSCKIQVGQLIIITPGMFKRINMDGQEFCFVPENGVVIIACPETGITSGPLFSLLYPYKKKASFIDYEEEIPNCGIDSEGTTWYFHRHHFRVVIAGKEMIAVKKTDLYAYQTE
jgi:hypothetical protein